MKPNLLIEVIRAPHVSEKTAKLQEQTNQYVFEVAFGATKAIIKASVEKLFEVKVENVSVLNVKGKYKAFRGRTGRRGTWRKAYVRLSEGQTIDLMAKA
jgi:large subunit ribosomal protein L23